MVLVPQLARQKDAPPEKHTARNQGKHAQKYQGRVLDA